MEHVKSGLPHLKPWGRDLAVWLFGSRERYYYRYYILAGNSFLSTYISVCQISSPAPILLSPFFLLHSPHLSSFLQQAFHLIYLGCLTPTLPPTTAGREAHRSCTTITQVNQSTDELINQPVNIINPHTVRRFHEYMYIQTFDVQSRIFQQH